MSDNVPSSNPDASEPKPTPFRVVCPQCYGLNSTEAERCIHCCLELYVECLHCGHSTFRGLDLCHCCHGPLRQVRIVHVTAPRVMPSRVKRPSVFEAWSSAVVVFAASCLFLFGIMSGMNAILDYYAHSQPPIEYTLGLPPYEDPAAPPPLERHHDPPLLKHHPALRKH